MKRNCYSIWSEHLQSKWEEIFQKEPGLVCVDFDNTFVRGDFGEQIMDYLLLHHYPLGEESVEEAYSPWNASPSVMEEVWGWSYENKFREPKIAKILHLNKNPQWRDYVFEEYQYIRDTQGLGESYRWSSFIFSGWNEARFRSLCRNIWLEHQKGYQENPKHYQTYPIPYPMKVHPREPLLALLLDLKKLGWTIQIVTASPAWAVEETTPELGLKKEDVIGMQLETNPLGKTKATILEPYPYGEGKVIAILKKFGKTPDIAFGDTINDLPMLSNAKLGVLFQRGFTELNQIAKERGIHIENWI